jgi:hypothetical protein
MRGRADRREGLLGFRPHASADPLTAEGGNPAWMPLARQEPWRTARRDAPAASTPGLGPVRLCASPGGPARREGGELMAPIFEATTVGTRDMHPERRRRRGRTSYLRAGGTPWNARVRPGGARAHAQGVRPDGAHQQQHRRTWGSLRIIGRRHRLHPPAERAGCIDRRLCLQLARQLERSDRAGLCERGHRDRAWD